MIGNSRAIYVQEPCNEKPKKDGLGIEYKKKVAMFNQETCQRCGRCLTLYPFLEMPKDEAAAGISHMIEAELSGLDVADQKEFLASLGITEPAFGRIIRGAFSLLGRMSFFTVGEDAVKAWVIPRETKAPKAAGAIHNDFERGFIKAEVMSYDDFIAHSGSTAQVKSAGRLRLEGKEYIVQDGDIITFRFNV